MNWQEGSAGRYGAVAAAAILALALVLGQIGARAQETSAGPAAAVEAAPVSDMEGPDSLIEGGLSPEELQALVAPIALYPDLVLVLTLQASLAPLDIVLADRFLADYAEDPALEPDPGWDESVIGLLNYPTVVRTMSADLTWTEALGTAVITQLEGVQDAIQEFRAFMRAVGALESNEQVNVIAEGDVIRLEPTDENAVFIPQYDPAALLAALYSTDAALAPTATGAEALAEPQGEMVEAAEQEVVTETEATEGAAPIAEPVPAAAPAYYPALAPPPVTYSDPSPSWLGTAATFAGGAVVGGLVGWAIADDDDDGDSDGDQINRGNVNIEDSTVVVNRGDDRRGDELDDLERRAQTERLKRDAREKAQREQAKRHLEQRYAERQPRASETRSGSQAKLPGLATSGSRQSAAVPRGSGGERQLATRSAQAAARAEPGRRATAPARPAATKSVRAGDRQEPQVTSAFGGTRA